MHQAFHFRLDAGLGQVQLGLGHQGIHHGLFVAGLQTEFDFTLQVFADVGAQTVDGAVGNAQGLGQCLVHFGHVGGFDLVDRDEEVSGFACHVFAVVVGREAQGEGLAFARLHATHGIFEFFQHLAFADQKLEPGCFATGEGFAVDLAFEIDGHAVAVLGTRVHGALREGAALLAQDVQGLVDGCVADFSSGFFHFGRSQVGDFDVGEHLEHRVKQHFTVSAAFFFRNAGGAGHAQLRFVGGHRKGFTHFVVHDFVVHGVAITLGHHVEGHFAWTEAVHLDLAGHALEAGFHLIFDGIHGQRERHFAFELVQGFNGHGHVISPKKWK